MQNGLKNFVTELDCHELQLGVNYVKMLHQALKCGRRLGIFLIARKM